MNEINTLAATHLGNSGGYSDQYDPSLLVAIPRSLNREEYGIEVDQPFQVGSDVWNAYEVSALTNKGLPVTGMLKISYGAFTESHVESKSLKLYLNSFNMTKLGDTTVETIYILEQRIKYDLEEIMQSDVSVTFHSGEDDKGYVFGQSFVDLGGLTPLDAIEFTTYETDKNILSFNQVNPSTTETYLLRTNLLRSNCRVTNQPDWGDLFLLIKTDKNIHFDSIVKYVVSHRSTNHFHEEVVEAIYVHLTEIFEPEELMVAAQYTRRGGIDINPIRASHDYLIPKLFTDTTILLSKTLRQ